MKTVIIHGQARQGSTCAIARELAEKVGGEVQEFFLPRDFEGGCKGCFGCLKRISRFAPIFKSWSRCPMLFWKRILSFWQAPFMFITPPVI